MTNTSNVTMMPEFTNTTLPNSTYYYDDWYAYHGFGYGDNMVPLLCVSMVVGLLLFIHSHYLHGHKYTTVRIWSEVADIILILQCIFTLLPIVSKTTISDYNKWLLNTVAINITAIEQMADNYLTFARFEIIVGGVSNEFKWCVFIYCFLFLYMTWIPYGTVISFWFDTTTLFWYEFYDVTAVKIYFSAYFAYDVFFLLPVIYKMIQTFQIDATSFAVRSKQKVMLDITIRACLHTLASIFAVYVIIEIKYFGQIYCTLMQVVGMHIFLNWKIKWNKIKKISPFGSPSEAPTSTIYFSNADPEAHEIELFQQNLNKK